MSCRMCWRGWTRPIRRSSGACGQGRRQASRAFRAATAINSFTYKEYGNGARLDQQLSGAVQDWAGGGALESSAGRHAQDRHHHAGRPMAGTSAFSCADVPMQPLPLTGQETGIDLGWNRLPPWLMAR